MGKWLPIDYSFIFVPISLIILVSVRKSQKNFHTKMSLVRHLTLTLQKNNYQAAIYELSLLLMCA